jgi:ATP-dependent DNA helicase RecG
MLVENQTTEFKREYTDNIKKTVIAFANTDGGKPLSCKYLCYKLKETK